MASRLFLWIACLLAAAAPALAQPALPDSLRETRARAQMVAGMLAMSGGDAAAAVPFFEYALDVRPGDPTTLAAMAEAHLALGDPAAALLFAERAATAAEATTAHLLLRVDVLSALGRADEAREHLVALAEAQRLSPAERLALLPDLVALDVMDRATGVLFDWLRSHSPAAAHAQRPAAFSSPAGQDVWAAVLTAANTDDAPIVVPLMLADAHLEADRPDDALNVLATLDPTNVSVRPLLADALYRLGRTDDARAVLDGRPVAQAQPSGPTAATDALSDLRARLQQRPADGETLLAFLTLALQDGHYAEGASHAAALVRSAPRNPAHWVLAADVLLRADRPVSALRIADEGLLLFPGHLPLLERAAQAARYTDPAAASRFADDALAIHTSDTPDDVPTRARLLALRALLATEADNDASMWLEQLETLSTGAPLLQAERSLTMEQPDAADAFLNNVTPSETTDLNQVLLSARLHLARRQFTEARDVLTGAAPTHTGSPALYFWLGEALSGLGETDPARTAWARARSLEPDAPWLIAALAERPEN